MDTQRWELAGSIFERLLGTPEEKRELLLQTLCGADDELKDVVISMLESESSAIRFERALAANELPTATVHAADNPDSLPGGRVGPWLLVRKIDSGGMGVVWLGERVDGQFEQRAAIKLIKRGMDSEAVLKRFLRERQILARLVHPHIAHLLDGGISADGRPYFAMEYVEGLPLLRYCHDRGMQLEERIRLFLRVCEAVQFAHVNHVVHRDLKPSNILVTAGGDVKLLDFGIAKLLEGDAVLEETITELQRERPMTPMYAAPEQIRGERITEVTDVYALGCVLYELLTGQHARDVSKAVNIREVQQIVETTDPVAPSRLKLASMPVARKRLRGDLDTIVLTALRREPARRYASAAAFAADLKNFLDGKPISARRDSAFYRGWKFLRRRRTGLAASLAVATIALAAILFELRERAPPVPAPGSAIAIVDFNNLSPQGEDEWMRAALEEELATELAVGGVLHTLPGEIVRPAHKDLPAPQTGGYAQSSLQTLRRRLGADYVLSGSYLVSGPQESGTVRLDLSLQDTRSGVAVAKFSQSGALVDLPKLVERAGSRLRDDLGIASGTAARQQAARVRPATLELSRRMALATEALHNSDPARARDELLEVNIMAPDYAPAYVYLAQAFKALGFDSKARAAAQKAATHAEGLPPDVRLQIARQVAVQKSDWAGALKTDQDLLDLDPKNLELHLALVEDLIDSGNPEGAEAALKKIAELPDGDDPRVEIKASALARIRGDTTAQVRHAELALSRAQQRDQLGLAAAAKRSLGVAARGTGDHERAAALFGESINDFQRSENPRGEAGARTSLANLLRVENKSDAAREEYERALAIYQRIGDQDGMAAIYGNMGLLLVDRGDRDAAEVAARHVLEIRRETGDLAGQAWASQALANLMLDDSAGDATMDMYRQAVALDERAGERAHHIIALNDYADALRQRGELDKASEVCESARAEASLQSNSNGVTGTELRCAQISLDRGNIAEAVGGFERTKKLAQAAHEADTQVHAELGLAKIDFGQGQFAAAAGRFESAARYFAEGERFAWEAIAQAQLALCYHALKRSEHRDRAAARSRELRSAITTRVDAATVDILLTQLKGMSGQRREAISRLLEFAQDAQKRYWIARALDAKLAAVGLLDEENDPSAAQLRKEVEQTARQHGFGWILARLSHQ